MLPISEEFIRSVAPNQNAIANGMDLVKKKAFVRLDIAADQSLILGECQGSGAANYIVSVDFIRPDSPVFRCSCPSRQIPCKHVLGLLYAYFGGSRFAPAEIPADVLAKREKAGKNQEKQGGERTKPTPRVNKSAIRKKMAAQLEGLELLQKILQGIIQSGLGALNPKTLNMLEGQAKQLGNYYLTYPQIVLRDFIYLFKNTSDPEPAYSIAIDRLTRLYSLAKKGREYLCKRMADSELTPETNSAIEEMLGHTWQLAELKDLGLVQSDAELIQLQFYSWYSQARNEYIDAGAWLNLKTGQIHKTLAYRPVKAAKHIREDDSVFDLVRIPELFTYPSGDINIRVRWEAFTLREMTEADFATIRSRAGKSVAELVKTVKNQLKNSLADKYPVALLHFSRIGIIDGALVAEDGQGQRIRLADADPGIEPPSTGLLELLSQEKLRNNTLLVRFHRRGKTLCVQPLTLVTDREVIRLTF